MREGQAAEGEKIVTKSIGEFQSMIKAENGYVDSREVKNLNEWCTILVLPKTRENFWGFGKDEEASYLDAVKQYGAKRANGPDKE